MITITAGGRILTRIYSVLSIMNIGYPKHKFSTQIHQYTSHEECRLLDIGFHIVQNISQNLSSVKLNWLVTQYLSDIVHVLTPLLTSVPYNKFKKYFVSGYPMKSPNQLLKVTLGLILIIHKSQKIFTSDNEDKPFTDLGVTLIIFAATIKERGDHNKM